MLDKIIKVKYFDGLTYRTYGVGKDNVIAIDLSEMIRITIKDRDGKRYIFIKSEYIELFTKSTY